MARFLVRILCSLALVLAAWPTGASAALCVTPVEPVQPKGCKMACCPKAPVAEMACHRDGPTSELKAKADCSCELKAALPVAMPSEKATLQTVHLDFALSPAPLPILTGHLLRLDPVVFGSDSSPPSDAQHRPSCPRAPPVVRA